MNYITSDGRAWRAARRVQYRLKRGPVVLAPATPVNGVPSIAHPDVRAFCQLVAEIVISGRRKD
jgi:hypothetical protein